jgi:hypothetical protein
VVLLLVVVLLQVLCWRVCCAAFHDIPLMNCRDNITFRPDIPY